MERRGRGSFPCVYFAKEGFCAKGRHCEFVHERPGPCKNFLSPEGCRFGSRCMFSHAKPRPPSTVVHSPVVLDSPPATSTRTMATETKTPGAEDPWGFGETAESVYFYGAAGATTFERPKKYSDVVGRVSTTEESNNGLSSSSSRRKVCGFFKAGYCMFGDRCRNLHPEDASEEAVLEEESGLEEKTIECGICMSLPQNRVFGLLNNCSCVFCLDCIKNWRKEGLTFEDATQVRLCPLCRVVSYYVIPSRIVPTIEQKSKVVQAYRTALSNIPCQVLVYSSSSIHELLSIPTAGNVRLAALASTNTARARRRSPDFLT